MTREACELLLRQLGLRLATCKVTGEPRALDGLSVRCAAKGFGELADAAIADLAGREARARQLALEKTERADELARQLAAARAMWGPA